MKTLTVILSVLGTVCICIPPLLKGKKMKLILLLVCLTNGLIGVSYALTGAWNGTASCAVGAISAIVNYFFERQGKPLPKWLIAVYAVAFAVVNLLVFASAKDVLALLAAFAFVLAISQSNGKRYRVWALTNAGLWVAYDIAALSFGPLTTHLIQTAIIVAGMIIHDRKKSAESAQNQ